MIYLGFDRPSFGIKTFGSAGSSTDNPELPQTDIYFSNVASLMHFDSSSTNSDSKDEKGLLWTFIGDKTKSRLTTDDSVFGGSSVYFDNNTDGIHPLASEITNAFDFSAGDKFTLEFFFKKTHLGGGSFGNACMVGVIGEENAGRWAFFCRSGDPIKLAVYDGATFMDVQTESSIDSWAHFAYVKDGSINKVFIDGKLMAAASRNTKGFASSIIYLSNSVANNEQYTGYIDEFRITKNIARYSEDFDKPTSPF